MVGLAILIILVAYIFGSIPVGYLVARARGVDLLHSGSGRIGGTNVLRSTGLIPALITILGDAFKGLIPTYIAVGLFPDMPWVAALTGIAAVLGHNYSIFLKFKGGVGGVTALAALAALSFPAAVLAAFVAICAIVITRFASMASFSGSVTGLIMLVVFALVKVSPGEYIIYGVIVFGLVCWALRPNFASIKAGTERKIGASEEEIKTIS
jgi:glycerol-3-phosphate acyltransferase PlsY